MAEHCDGTALTSLLPRVHIGHGTLGWVLDPVWPLSSLSSTLSDHHQLVVEVCAVLVEDDMWHRVFS